MLKKIDYQLVWSDEFKGSTLDMTKWSHRYPGNYKLSIKVGVRHSFVSKAQNEVLSERLSQLVALRKSYLCYLI